MIALKHQTGWAVKIVRADGTSHFSLGGLGLATPTWSKSNRKHAKMWADELKRRGFDARVVPVTYAHPVEIPKAKKR